MKSFKHEQQHFRTSEQYLQEASYSKRQTKQALVWEFHQLLLYTACTN